MTAQPSTAAAFGQITVMRVTDMVLGERLPSWLFGTLLMLVLCACVERGHGQVLDQQIVSVTAYETCTESPLGSTTAQDVDGVSVAEQLSTGGGQNTVDPCNGVTGQVLAMELRLSPNTDAGGQRFVFRVGETASEAARGNVETAAPQADGVTTGDGNAGDVLTCANTVTGRNCQVLQEDVTLTIATSQLFAAYDLRATTQRIPHTYRQRTLAVSKSEYQDIIKAYGLEDSAPSSLPETGEQYVLRYPCSELSVIADIVGESNVFVPSTSSIPKANQDSTQPVFDEGCPRSGEIGADNEWQAYYVPSENGAVIPEADHCSVLLVGKLPPSSESGNKNDNRAFFMRAFQEGPFCSIYDTEPRAKPAMHLRFDATFQDTAGNPRNASFLLGTEQYGVIGGIPGFMFAQVNGVNTVTGLVGPYNDGQYVICNTCPSDAGSGCVEGIMDDLASGGNPARGASAAQLKTLFNPYEEFGLSGTATDQNLRCPFSIPACRKLFGGTPSTAFSYYVPNRRRIENAAGLCNSNGLGGDPYSNVNIRRYVALNAQQCDDAYVSNDALYMCGAEKACIPGFEQPGQANFADVRQIIGNTNFVNTPCQVSRKYAESVVDFKNAIDSDALNSVVFAHTEPDYNAVRPQYFHQGTRVYRDPYGGTSPTLSVTVYVVAEDVISVVSLAPGRFIVSGQSCGGSNGGEGSIGFMVGNIGSTVGTYVVDIGFKFPSGEDDVGSQQITLNPAVIPPPAAALSGYLAGMDVVTRDGPFSVAVNSNTSRSVTYVYAGQLGAKLTARLVLRFESASDSQILQVVDLACDVVLGANDDVPPTSFILDPEEPVAGESGGSTRNCWILNMSEACRSKWNFWNWLFFALAVILILTLSIVGITIMVYLCIECTKSRKTAKLLKQTIAESVEARQSQKKNN